MFASANVVNAQRGRQFGGVGGARPSISGVGGVGTRANISRPMPSGPNYSMPNVSRPNLGNAVGNAGGFRPNIQYPNGQVPHVSRPNIPNIQNPNLSRPNVNLPNVSVPSIYSPSLGSNRPALGGMGAGNNLPSLPSMPTNPSGPLMKLPRMGTTLNEKPSLGNIQRPSTLPGISNRPGVTNPGIGSGGGGKPGIVGDRPNVGGNRPNVNLPNRPGVNVNRPNIGGNTNINIGNGSNNGNRPSNRPNWDIGHGVNRPNWGLGSNWHDHWHDNCIHHHHQWYNGCWHSYWGSSWYAPVAWVGVGWGLKSWTSGWEYGSSYQNPYFVASTVVASGPYDYSQPVVINNYASGDALVASAPLDSPELQQSLTEFDVGLAQFRVGDYVNALASFDKSLKSLPGDAVVHEVRCLCLYALGDYRSAAAGLNSLLSSAPGMDWTTTSSLYGNPDDYTTQLRKLEQFCKSNPTDASAIFVLAYHYLMIGEKSGAIEALKLVVKNQSNDVTASRMLNALVPRSSNMANSSLAAPSNVSHGEGPFTDLVGSWSLANGATKIELEIDETSQFHWKTSESGKVTSSLRGTLIMTDSGIELMSLEQGSIAGTVQSVGPDSWKLFIEGAPASDSGLLFARNE
jgi:hypothetical protein